MPEDYKWLLNQGVAVAAFVFLGWCVLQSGRFFAPIISGFIGSIRSLVERIGDAFSDMMHGLHDNSNKQTVLMQSIADCQQVLARNDDIQNQKLDRIHEVVSQYRICKGAVSDGKTQDAAEVR